MRRRWSDEDGRQVGREIAAARSVGVPWKVLSRVYGRSREQLWRLAEPYATSFPAYATSAALRHGEDAESAVAA